VHLLNIVYIPALVRWCKNYLDFNCRKNVTQPKVCWYEI